MIRAIKGKPGCFEDEIIIPEFFKEVEPRRFVGVIRLGEFREEDKWDTVVIAPGAARVSRLDSFRYWLLSLVGEKIGSVGEEIVWFGRKLQNRASDFVKEKL